MIPTWQVLVGDVREQLRPMPDRSVHCVVTSPPYWGMRDYGTATWTGGSPDCDHLQPMPGGTDASNLGGYDNRVSNAMIVAKVQRRRRQYEGECRKCGALRADRQIGLEFTPDRYIAHLVDVFREVRRVLRDDGTLWLNIGDCHANDGKFGGETSGKQAYLSDNDRTRVGRSKRRTGLKPKELVGIPWQLAFALRDDGWCLRQANIWSKPNPLPESVDDRPSTSHEFVFLLSKGTSYFYDAFAIDEPVSGNAHPRGQGTSPKTSLFAHESRDFTTPRLVASRNRRSVWTLPDGHEAAAFAFVSDLLDELADAGVPLELVRTVAERAWDRNPMAHAMGAILNSVWQIPTQPYADAHFATFPEDLPTICIKAGTSEHGACPMCAAPYRRLVEKGEELRAWKVATGCNRDGEYHGQALKPYADARAQNASDVKRRILEGMREKVTVGWQPTCGCAIGCPDEPDALEVIETQLGDDAIDDPTLETGRAGFNRPRLPGQGTRPITRYEQRRYAKQLKAIRRRDRLRFDALVVEAGGSETMAHYLRTDRTGARPLPPDLLEQWLSAGVLERVDVPTPAPLEPVPCVVMDIFNGSGTTGAVAVALRRSYLGIELKADYVQMSRRRIGAVAPLMATEVSALKCRCCGDTVRCSSCGARAQTSQERWQQKQLRLGRCPRCRKKKTRADGKHFDCRDCRQKSSERNKRRYQTHGRRDRSKAA